MRGALAALCLALYGCALDVALEGRRCDDAHRCVDEWSCVDGRCVEDGAPRDAGEQPDAGGTADAGRPGELDAGADAGQKPDGGPPPDAGMRADAGAQVDAGGLDAGDAADAGVGDAGAVVDGGGDGGPDCQSPPNLPEARLRRRSIGVDTAVLWQAGSASLDAATGTIAFVGGGAMPGGIGAGDLVTAGGGDYHVAHVLRREEPAELAVEETIAASTSGVAFQVRRAYPTLQAWYDARTGDLIARDAVEKGVMYDDGPLRGSLHLFGAVTDLDHFFWLTAAEGHRHDGVAGTGVRLDVDGELTGIRIEDRYTIIEWLELYDSTPEELEVRYGVRDDVEATLRHLIVHDVGQSLAGGRANTAGYTSWTSDMPGATQLYNSIFYNVAGQGVQLVRTTFVANVSVFRSTGYGVMSYVGFDAFTVRNVVALGNNTGFEGTAADFEADVIQNPTHNASSDMSAYGVAPLIGVEPATTFVSVAAGAEDLHLAAGATVRGEGVALSGVFGDDIDGECRSAAWDIGADQGAP